MDSESFAWVPLANTSLIVVSGLFLLTGYALIRARKIQAHRRAMLTAVVFAGLFLVVYVARALLLPTKIFAGEGLLRVVYLAVLGPHVLLAIAIVPLILVVLYRAFSGQFDRHRRLARVTLPVWLYVVISGWAVYMMLYAL